MKHLILFVIAIVSTLLPGCQPSKETKPPKAVETLAKVSVDLKEATIADIQKQYKSGTSITQVVTYYLNRIKYIDQSGPSLGAIIATNPDALTIAQQLDEEMKAGKTRGPLHGIPVVLKDNIDTHDQMPCTAGSRALAGSLPLKDSPIAKQLREAGAVIIAKANLSEWANFRGRQSISGWSGLGGQAKNPYDTTRNPCGSSAGSGVAVSANLCVFAIGTETNGSIVCPSSANGVVGIKPTVGLLSRTGIIPISFTQDTAGPMARTVTDAAVALGTMTAIDSADAKTLGSTDKRLNDYTPFLKADGLKGKKIGLYKQALGNNLKVDALMEETVEKIRKLGAEVVDIEKLIPDGTGGLSFQIMLMEYKDGLNQYFAALGPNAPIKSLEDLIAFNEKDSVELMHFGQQYLKMAQEKPGMDSEEYQNTLSKMQENARKQGIDKVMDELGLDAIIGPTGSPAWKTDYLNGDNYGVSSSSPAAWAGYPNISVPMGFIEGLPVGISFFGRAWSEPTLIEIAFAFEQATQVRKAPRW